MLDPKIIAAVATIVTPVLGAIGLFVWGRGKRAGIAAVKQHLAELHEKQVAAAKTDGTEDDDKVAAEISATKAILAGLEAL